MTTITGTTAVDWSTVSFDTAQFANSLSQFESRFDEILYGGQLSITSSSSTFITAILYLAGQPHGTVSVFGSGLDGDEPIIKDIQYSYPAGQEALRLVGTIDFWADIWSITSIQLAGPGVAVSFGGNLLMD